jgi:hypothetical protein
MLAPTFLLICIAVAIGVVWYDIAFGIGRYGRH